MNTNNTIGGYLWDSDNQRIITLTIEEIYDLTYKNKDTKEVRSLFCLDTTANTIAFRYGYYKKDYQWQYQPFDEFPSEFKLQLLLLGVT